MIYKIDPDNCTDFSLDKNGLELHILFWIFAAGKNGHTASRCLNNILQEYSRKTNLESPFDIFKNIEDLPQELKKFGVGCFNNKSKCVKNLISKNFDLSKCTIEDLESVWGLGPKSVRCFLIHTRKNQQLAGLDRHVLRYLSELGYKVPKSTPNKKQYLEIEKIFIELAKSVGKTISEFDLEIWTKYRKKTA
jgi:thermostable 8-oxoguanine DNA glycosylase